MAGVNVERGVDLDDAIDVTSMMVMTGRVPPPSKWVDQAIDDAASDEVEGLF